MSVTVANIVTNVDSYISDTSTDRITSAERLQYITEAVLWLQESLQNDHLNASYDLSYFDTVNRYKITTAVPDVLDVCDLRRGIDDQTISFSRKSTRELYEEIGVNFGESSYALERVDSNWYLLVNHASKYPALLVGKCDSLTGDGGTWEADTTNSDATNVTADSNEFTEGSGSINFDADVSQSGNNRATIFNDELTSQDLTDYEDLASFIVDVYIPDVTNFTSVTFYWGSSSTAYWSVTATTDINSNAFVAGWNTVKFSWASATMTSTPDVTAIDYLRIDFNYGAGQGDDTDFRIDNIRVVRPETLKFIYTSWSVGTNSGGTDLYAFTATTDIPFFSGKYDQYKYAVAHKAASLIFRTLRLKQESADEEMEAERALIRARKIVPSSTTPELHSFKVRGVNFNKTRFKRTR